MLLNYRVNGKLCFRKEHMWCFAGSRFETETHFAICGSLEVKGVKSNVILSCLLNSVDGAENGVSEIHLEHRGRS